MDVDAIHTALESKVSVAALADVLGAQEDLGDFSGETQIVFSSIVTESSFPALAEWLVGRAETVGPQTATEDLRRYVENDHYPYLWLQFIKGVKPSKTITFPEDDICIASIEDASERFPELSSLLHHQHVERYGKQDSVAIVKATHPKWHGDKPPKWGQEHAQPHDRTRLAIMLMSIYGPSSPSTDTDWNVPDPSVPLGRIGGSSVKSGGTVVIQDTCRMLSDSDCNDLPLAVAQFESREPSEQKKLSLAIRRLRPRVYRSFESPIEDKILDAAIAVEILLTGDTRDELKYRASLRAAKLLATTLEERQRVLKTIRALYDIRSAVVHTGKIPGKPKERENVQRAVHAQQDVLKLVRKLIRDGIPGNWQEIDLM